MTGVSSWFAKSMAPLARFGKAYGVRPGLLVSTAQEIRKDVKQWALFAAVGVHAWARNPARLREHARKCCMRMH